MLKTTKQIISLLDSQQRKRASILLIMILVMGLLEMIGVASIMPFITVLLNPEVIQTNNFLSNIYQITEKIGIKNDFDFLFFLGIMVFLLLVISLSFKALTMYIQLRFTKDCEYTIGKRLIETYLYQPYSWFLNRHSGDLGKSILSEANFVVDHGVNPIMNILGQCFVILALAGLLFFIDYKVALITSVLFLIVYGLVYNIVRKTLYRLGEERLQENQKRFISVNETFASIKEVKVAGLESIGIDKFKNPAKKIARIESSSHVISHLPRFGIEGIAFGGIVLTILFYMKLNNNFVDILPIFALYAFAGYRLIPAMQQVYVSSTYLRAVTSSLERLHNDLKDYDKIKFYQQQESDLISFNKEINLKNISYKYPNSNKLVLSDINIKIPKGSTIGLIGVTGSGKTTLVDIILGLLNAQEGTLEVDDHQITKKKMKSWQSIISYVPQNIYLSDDTISANIAFGINKKNINHQNIMHAARIAKIHDFINDELSEKYETLVGERGVRLSGGQRQRIGIARALYSKPKLLILDEATSALDDKTEKEVIDGIHKIGREITIISIAHRLSTLEQCDKICELVNGRIVNQITFKELMLNKKVNNVF